jgi:adenosylhomocysteine nucleosidase
MATHKVAIVAAMEREVRPLIRNWTRVQREHEGRTYDFFEWGEAVCVCGGIGANAARRAAEVVIALYHPEFLQSVGFAGALDHTLDVGDIFIPSAVIDARDGSRTKFEEGSGILLTFMNIASATQKSKLGAAYAAQAVDMEAAAVAATANKHGIGFAAIKVISDEVDFEIPSTENFIDHDGSFHTAGFVWFALLRPWLWPRIARLASNSRKATAALAKHLREALNSQSSQLANTTFIARRPN